MQNSQSAVAVATGVLVALSLWWFFKSVKPKAVRKPLSLEPESETEPLSHFETLLKAVALSGPTEAEIAELGRLLEEVARRAGPEGLKEAQKISAKFHQALGQWFFFRVLRRT